MCFLQGREPSAPAYVVSHACVCCSSSAKRECEGGAGRMRVVARVTCLTVIKADPSKDQ